LLTRSGVEPFGTGSYRILIVDDNPDLVQLVEEKLRQEGFEVFTASSGPQALEIMEKDSLPHLAIVDLMMPGMNGFEFCRIVQQFCDLPIIMFTAIDQEEVVIQGLEQYAEDYITKPFSPRELVARVRRVLRRIGDFAYTLEALTCVDDHLEVDFVQQQAIIEGQQVTLTPIETKLLYILMRNAGNTTTTDFLIRCLWPSDEVYEDTLRVHVHRLRQKIESDPANPRYIITDRGAGYSFPMHN